MSIGRRRWIRALLAGVIALCLATPFNAGRATAAPAGCAGCHVGLDWNVADGGGWGQGWAGSYVINTPSSSKVAFCMEPEKSYPNRPVNFAHAGSTADTWDAQRIGYLMWRYGDSNANNAAATAMLVHKFFAPSLGDMMWNSFPGLQGLANQLWSESNENTGPYSFRPGVKRVEPSWDNDLTFEVDFTVQGGGGQDLGFDVPTSWVQNINNFNVKNVSVTKRANSVFTVKGQVDDPAEAWRTGARLVNTVNGVDRWTPIGAGDVQDLLSPMFRPASDPTNVGGPPVKYRPQIASVTQDVLVDAGSELADTIRVWDGRVDDPFNGKSTLYGPYASNAEAQSVAFSDDKIVGAVEFSGTYDNDKQASLTTSPLKVESPGFYVWREELFETQKAVAVGQADGGRATETSAVLAPQITSRISSQRIVPNDSGVFTSGDSVVVSGLTPAVGDKPVSWTLSGGLYGPVKPGGENQSCDAADWSDAPVVDTFSREITAAEINDAGIVTLDNVASSEVTADGAARCVSWAWKIDGKAPDGTSVSSEHPVGDPTQTGVIVYYPDVSTTTSSQLIGPNGGQLADNVRVFNGVPGLKFSGRTGLYGPFATPEEAATFKLPGDGDRNPVGDELAALQAGAKAGLTPSISSSPWWLDGPDCYRSTVNENVAMCFVNGHGLWRHDTPEGMQTVDLGEGESLADIMTRAYPAATLLAEKPAPAEPTEDPTQEDPADTASEATIVEAVPNVVREFSGVFDENGEATLTVESFQVDKIGYYVWVEELDQQPNGGEVNPPNIERRPPETTVGLNPTISTQISNQSAERGSRITDTAKLTGLITHLGEAPIGWVAEVQLYGPIAPNPQGGCTDLDWSNAELADTQTVEINPEDVSEDGTLTLTGVGGYSIPKYGPRGCYTYGEVLTATGPDGSKVTVSHEPGNPTQTTLVPYGGLISTGVVPGALALPGGAATAVGAGVAVALSVALMGEWITRRRRVAA